MRREHVLVYISFKNAMKITACLMGALDVTTTKEMHTFMCVPDLDLA
jgi:hypothetical protein